MTSTVSDQNEPSDISQMAMTDWGEPGSTGPGPDTIALTVYNGSSLWFSSQWNGTQTIQKLLDGGNLVAH